MSEGYLLDTGFIVALVDARDPDHARCSDAWKSVRGRLVSVDGVIAEAAHLLRRSPGGVRHAVELAIAAGTDFIPSSPKRFRRALDLIDKYRDIPMDWVDALLVVNAEETGIRQVLTLDERGFLSYRIHGRHRFNLFPSPK